MTNSIEQSLHCETCSRQEIHFLYDASISLTSTLIMETVCSAEISVPIYTRGSLTQNVAVWFITVLAGVRL
jgi:hypothetical protein